MNNNQTPYLDAPFNLTGAPMPTMQSHQVEAFGNQHAARQTAASSGMWADLGAQATKMQDYKTRVDSLDQMQAIQKKSEEEAERGLTVAPGHPDSFYYADGSTNQDKVEEFYNRYREQYASVTPSFSSRQGDMEFEQERNNFLNNSLARLTGRAVSHELSSIRRSSEARIESARNNRDWQGVLNEGERQVEAGIMSQDEYDNLDYEITNEALSMDAQNAWNQSPAELARLWDEGHFDEASADVQGNVQRMLARAGGLEIPQTQMRRVANKDGSERVEKLPPEAPRGLPSYLVRSWNENGGDFKTPDAKAASAPLLANWAKSQITSVDNPEEVERVKTVFKAYGASDAYASSIISTLQKDLGGGQTFNSSDSWDMMHEDAFFTEEQQDNIYWWKDRAAYLSTLDSAFLDEKKNEDGELLADELKRIKANLKEWDGYRKEENTKAKAAIEGEFIAWKSRNPDADYRDQYEEYWNITDRYLEKERGEQVDHTAMSAYQVGGNTAKEYENQVATAQKDMELARDENNKDVAQTEAMRNQPEEPLQEVQAVVEETSYPISTVRGASNALEGNTTEAILYVPKGTSMTDKEILIRAEGDIASYARIVESDKVTEPTMSRRLRGNLGDYTGQNKTITISGKNAYLSKQSSTQSNKAWATGGFAGELNPARLPAPLQPYAQDFIELGNKYGVNPALLAAISMHETGNGTSKAFKNRRNAMGISNSKGVIDQPSVRASIEHMARLMGRAKMYKGRELTEIASVYAPVGAGNDPRGYNQYWTRGVSQYLNQITN